MLTTKQAEYATQMLDANCSYQTIADDLGVTILEIMVSLATPADELPAGDLYGRHLGQADMRRCRHAGERAMFMHLFEDGHSRQEVAKATGYSWNKINLAYNDWQFAKSCQNEREALQ